MARTPAPGTRERILATASRLFYAHGVRAVGMNRIISEAGTGKNLLYQHFTTKDDLVAGYLGRVRERRVDAIHRALDAAGDDPRDRLVALVGELGDLVTRTGSRGCAFRNYLVEFPDDSPAGSTDGADTSVGAGTPATLAREHLAEVRAVIDGLVGELGTDDPDRLADELCLVVDGLFMQAAHRDPDGLRRGADTAVRLTRRLVGA
ncbi:TetR/AcrR family transcriptional regulator [Pseudonocardia sp. ICBG1293]|uniref:TetR/AcrR family transcriptional regulator n=1 Tax=Pseudonocardia sp. ICBG1293 TaxID=2844382 RepID=UPI001CCD909C|nr:TetR/AcrR family transcriptional regulator [Pseudonocardia sp. ICBG1293]